MLALAVSAGCMYAVRNSERGRILLPLFAYPILAAADLWSIYNELQAVELKMLNRERSEMLAEQWVATGRAPSAAEVGGTDGFRVAETAIVIWNPFTNNLDVPSSIRYI